VALVFALGLSILRYLLLRLRGPLTLEKRAQWTHQASRNVLSIVGVRLCVEGTPPSQGLIVANHLSYLDILILSAIMPCIFISKIEIGSWPYFGWAARAGGTIFLDRASRASANLVAAQMSERLMGPVPVLLFPEGTSTDGSRVRHFHSRLIDPAIKAGVPITAAAVCYLIEDGTPEDRLCWVGEALFLPHLLATLATPGFSARVRFGDPCIYTDRRAAATATHAEVTAMRTQLPLR
jgi:1-acyl-sn-glycerol-3-phosphate acyltransferase